jgi:hypothetical protein
MLRLGLLKTTSASLELRCYVDVGPSEQIKYGLATLFQAVFVFLPFSHYSRTEVALDPDLLWHNMSLLCQVIEKEERGHPGNLS